MLKRKKYPALLAPDRRAQEDARLRREEQRRDSDMHRRSGVFGLAGFVVGGAIGYLMFDNFVPASIVGFGLGFVLGRFLDRRAG